MNDKSKAATSIRGDRKKGFSPRALAAVTAASIGVQEMLRSGLTVGNAAGATVGSLAAFVVADVTNASKTEAVMIGGIAGSFGIAVGNKIDTKTGEESSLTILELYPNLTNKYIEGL
ncbi:MULTISPECIES: hypothetical protein [unclassified Pseudomonas]|uniref:hypothetical protein n=1 Tax=unclassified Pseudomonas TaxID=196821 RepID=UPI001F568DB3|nr:MULTISPECIES: hypothetical protein [unclassified Pseudomonas]